MRSGQSTVEGRVQPRWTALGHPGWWLALGLLVVNDHLLKGAGVLPGWLTGKLSDFAGLAMAPAVVAALMGVRSRRGAALSGLAVAVGFAAINLLPSVARWVEASTAVTPFPWEITVDPSDLVALPMVWVGVWLWRQPLPTWWQPRIALRVATLPVAVAAMAGTSPPVEQCETDACFGTVVPLQVPGAIGLGNTTDQTIVLRVRPLAGKYALSCAAAKADPSAFFAEEHFDAAEAYTLEPGFVLPLDLYATRECSMYLVDGPGIPAFLVFFDDSYSQTFLSVAVADYPKDSYRLIEVVDAGDAFAVVQHPAVFPAPRPSEDAECPLAPAEAGPAWSALPATGDYTVTSANGSSAGCWDLVLRSGERSEQLGYCIPGLDVRVTEGDQLHLRPLRFGDSGEEIDGFELVANAGEDAPEGHRAWRLRVARGDGVAPLGLPGVDAAIERRSECGLSSDECGDRGRPAVLVLQKAGQELGRVMEGESLRIEGTTVHLFRAAHLQLADSHGGCDVSFGFSVDSAVVEAFDRGVKPSRGVR